jgi:ribonuclease J
MEETEKTPPLKKRAPRPMGSGSHSSAGGSTGRKSTGSRGPRRDSYSSGKRQPSTLQREKSPIMPYDSKVVTTDRLRVIPLGGVEEVGKNMTAFEYKDVILVVDAGIHFPGHEFPGIDYVIPDVSYLEERKDRVKGLFITHGHLDHTGAIPYIMERIGNPTIYTRGLPAAFIKKRQDEFPGKAPLKLRIVEKSERIQISPEIAVRFFAVTHTIPESMGLIIETPFGNIIHTGDLKVDHKDGVPLPSEYKEFEPLTKEKNLVLLSDSTNTERPGFGFPEREVHENLRDIIKDSTGRLIFGTFASLLERIVFIIQTAEEFGKKIVIEGRSMKTNVEIAKELGLFVPKPHTIISTSDMERYSPEKIIILATGAQGDAYAALMRIANKNHKFIKIQKNDTIVLSSSVIPGNERDVQKLKDNLSRQGAHIVTQSIADVHSSGHAYSSEAQWIIEQIKPKYFIPIHGYHYMLRMHAEVAARAGIPAENVLIPDNGIIFEISDNGNKVTIPKQRAQSDIVMVDALGDSDVKEVVVRDRKALAEDGMFVIVAVIDSKTGKIRKSPDIISRGFIYLKESQDLLNQTRLLVKKSVEESVHDMHPINFDFVKNNLREKIGRFLYQQTKKRPMILPVLLEV